MPNTAVTVGEGATVYCLGDGAEQSDSLIVQKLFSSVGYCTRVTESQIGEQQRGSLEPLDKTEPATTL